MTVPGSRSREDAEATAASAFGVEKVVPKGGPDGGDGGKGGDVTLVADPDLRDLAAFRGKQRFAGGRGVHGKGANKHGAEGQDVELRVPVGTQVLDAEGGLLADLAHPLARAVVARGGLGGAGNPASPRQRSRRLGSQRSARGARKRSSSSG